MSVDEGVLEDGSPNVTTRNVVANLENRGELPLLVPVERRDGDTAGNVNGLGDFGDRCQGTLDTIVDAVEEARAEFDGERLAGTGDGVANRDTSCRGR